MNRALKVLTALIIFVSTSEAKKNKNAPGNISPIERFNITGTLEEQEKQLKDNPMLKQFKEWRKKLLEDPHVPRYHLFSPEGKLNDPNGLCFWKGKWHLFYQGYPPEYPKQHWSHVVSEDLIHWRDLPYALYPGPENACFSGSIYIEKDRAIAMYHGTWKGSMVAVANDPLLLNWKKLTGKPVIPLGKKLPYNIYDPCIWKHDDTYYALTPSAPGFWRKRELYLHKSKDLKKWKYMHEFLEGDNFALFGDDPACPYFWPIGEHGDKHILLLFSHMSGGKYLLGNYDTKRQKFVVQHGEDFNFGAFGPSGLHAPSAYPDGKGGVISIFNVNEGKPAKQWDRVMSLPRRLTLRKKMAFNPLNIEPAGDIESLRGKHIKVDSLDIPANKDIILEKVKGNQMEIIAEIAPQQNQTLEFNILRSENAEELTRIICYRDRGHRVMKKAPGQPTVVSIDTTRSSASGEVRCRPPETGQVEIKKNEPLKLRIFIDRSIVEVFINNRQCITARVYPTRQDSIGVSLRAHGKAAKLTSLEAWQLKSIYD